MQILVNAISGSTEIVHQQYQSTNMHRVRKPVFAAAFTSAVLAFASLGVQAQTDYCQANNPGSDPTATYCTQPNFPTVGTTTLPLPVNVDATRAMACNWRHLQATFFHWFWALLKQAQTSLRAKESEIPSS